MRDTRNIILDQALELFNKKGLPAVSFRELARALNMSPGNLSYHFKKKEEIVEALYHRLVASLAEDFDPEGKGGLEDFVPGMMAAMRKIFGYRFLMLNFVQVMREHPAIKEHFKQLQIMRKEQFKALFAALLQAGELQAEEYPNQHAHLVHRLSILGDFWMAEAEIHSDVSGEALFQQYAEVLSGEIWPYLTELGKVKFRRMMQG